MTQQLVQAWSETITIPTYPIGKPEKNPVFLEKRVYQGSSGAFLDAVAPQWALVQSGYRNRFAHPAPSVLARYAERHIAVADSPHCGAATWQSTVPQEVRCERVQERRYWHHQVP